MKLIDILNLIAKGELEEGTEFKFAGHTYFYKRGVLFDRHVNAGKLDWFSMRMLCDEVEIIGHDTNVATKIGEVEKDKKSMYISADFMSIDKLNEVIRELNGGVNDG